jgi:hypothetical protein
MYETLYRCLYWRRNEFELILADVDNRYIRAEIARYDRAIDWLVARIGFMPAP